MKRKNKLRLIIIASFLVIPVVYNLIVIRPKIYYEIEYDITLSNREAIINRVENLNYPNYLSSNCHYDSGLYEGITCYVDRNLVDFFKNRIEDDIWLHWVPWYQHNLCYSFLGENHTRLNLTYKDNWIYSLKDYKNQSLISGQFSWLDYDLYLNFAKIPNVGSAKSSLVLNDLIFVKMSVEYVWVCDHYLCYHDHSFEQYILLDLSLDVLLILVCYEIFID